MTVKFVICGMEHTGTTLVSDLFRQAPGIDAGFEVGVLLRDTPEKFFDLKPFSENILKGWGITKAELRDCCAASTHAQFYERLQHYSRSINPATTDIFDKTPRYIAQMESCLEKVDVPFILTSKDPRAIVASDFKRAGTDDFEGWYKSYMPSKRTYMKNCYAQWRTSEKNTRVFRIALEELAMNARASMEQMFAHVGLEFSLNYAVLKDLRFEHTRANSISAEIVFEFKSIFSASRQKRIFEDFLDCEEWYYS